MQLLQLLLEMAYLRCCVWIQAPLTAGCCLLAFAGAAFPHRHERHGLRLLRQAKHRRGDAAIQALGLAFLTKRAAGAAALSLQAPLLSLQAAKKCSSGAAAVACLQCTTSVCIFWAAPPLRRPAKVNRAGRGAVTRLFSPRGWAGRTHGASYPVAPLKWGVTPRRIALGKKLAP